MHEGLPFQMRKKGSADFFGNDDRDEVIHLADFHISFSFCGYFVGVDAYIDPWVDEGVRPNNSIKNNDAIIRKTRGFMRCVS